MTGSRLPAVHQGSDLEALGNLLASSGYFQDSREAAQAAVKVLAGQELGFGPIASMTGIHIVKGRVTLSANLMSAAIKRHPAYDYRVKERSDARAVIAFFQEGEHLGDSEFTMDDAKRAGLAGGESYRKYPRNMLFWRAMSNGASAFCPDAFAGAPVYTPDELGADVDPETGEMLSVENLEPAPAAKPARKPRAAKPAPAPEPEPQPTVAPDLSLSERHEIAAQTDRDLENGKPPEDVPVAVEPEPQELDEDRQINAQELAELNAELERVGVPESMWRMALIGHRAAELADLTVSQMREMMVRVVKFEQRKNA